MKTPKGVCYLTKIRILKQITTILAMEISHDRYLFFYKSTDSKVSYNNSVIVYKNTFIYMMQI